MSFIEFINENEGAESTFIKDLCRHLIEKIRDSKQIESEDYVTFSGMEFTAPFAFDLILNVRRQANAHTDLDSHFNDLPWEDINFKKKGYMIDANMRTNRKSLIVPMIELHMLLDPRREPSCYSELYLKLIDILTHETNHLDQVGLNRDHHNTNVTPQEIRKKAKKSNAYFLLPEEVESMVAGMYARSEEEGKPLDVIFYEYLNPFVKTKYISVDDFEKTMKTWITHAIQNYPNANFSPKAHKIINSI